MFNVRPDIDVPGFRFRAPDSTPGFRVNSGSEARPVPSGGGRALLYSNPNAEAAPFSPLDATDRLRYGFSEEDEGKPAEAPIAPALVPAPGSGGSGYDKCTLMPGIGQFRMCLYSCPDGTIRRLHGIGRINCPSFIFRNDGLGL
jgi:hypothetical protein